MNCVRGVVSVSVSNGRLLAWDELDDIDEDDERLEDLEEDDEDTEE